MYKISIHSHQADKTVEAEPGACLLDVLRGEQVKIHTPCGGRGRCGKCRVTVPGLTHTEQEKRLLTDKDISENIHLACLITVTGDMEVTLGDQSARMDIITDGAVALPKQPELSGKFAVGIDIGTTTVVCYLIDLGRGEITDIESAQNSQSVFGSDVISRLSYADEHGVEPLAQAIRSQLDHMIHALLGRAGLAEDLLIRVAIVGNTSMIHFLCEWDISGLCRAPFHPYSVATHILRPAELGLGLDEKTDIILPAGYSAFVGSDISAAVLASGLHQQEEPRVLTDIGTNGEIVAGGKNGMLCTSVAAGPAFEGGNIACGMPGFPGAVSAVQVSEGKPEFTVIGDGEPKGICGSGLIDLVAALLKLGWLDETGLLEDDIVTERDEREGYFITDEVYLLPADIRSIQLAKSAVYTGIEILVKEYGITNEEVAEFILAGGFGSRMNPQSAAEISLIPREFLDKTRSINNGAGMGAVLAACDTKNVNTIEEITANTRTVDLASHPDFMDTYVESMLF